MKLLPPRLRLKIYVLSFTLFNSTLCSFLLSKTTFKTFIFSACTNTVQKENWIPSLGIGEKVITSNKLYELQWREEGFLQVIDKMGAFGIRGLIPRE